MSRAFLTDRISYPASTASSDYLIVSGMESSLLVKVENIEAAALFLKMGLSIDLLIADVSPSLPGPLAVSVPPSLIVTCLDIDFTLLR